LILILSIRFSVSFETKAEIAGNALFAIQMPGFTMLLRFAGSMPLRPDPAQEAIPG
jgi:hypothetical protein